MIKIPKPKDRDFIETIDGNLFCVVGYLHPPEGYTAYLKYIPSENGKWERNGIKYSRSIPYYHVSQVERTYEYLKQKNPEYVFCSIRSGAPLKSLRKPFERALKLAGIDDFRFHDLRHTFASHYVMNGGDLLSLKELLGHSNMEMVGRYAHLAASHKHNLINRLAFSDENCHLFATLEKRAVSK